MTDMGKEMQDYIVGPMPATQFLDKFFPKNLIQSTSRAKAFKQGLFNEVTSCTAEVDAYNPFVGMLLMISLHNY